MLIFRAILQSCSIIFILVISLNHCSSNSELDYPKVWNLKDVVISPGQAFKYKLPDSEPEYQVTELGLNFLPDWLVYNSSGSELCGVPRNEDLGKSYYLEVKSSVDISVSDLFKIEVKDAERLELTEEELNGADDDAVSGGELDKTKVSESSLNEEHSNHHLRHQSHQRHHHRSDHHSHHEKEKGIRCKKSKSRTTASVILDVFYDDKDVSVASKIWMLQNFSLHYDLPLMAFRLVSSAEIGGGALFDSSALVAGPGDVAPELNSQVGGYSKSNSDDKSKPMDGHSVIHWTVGCGSVHKHQLTILQQVERESRDGTLRSIVGHGIIGWYVTNRKPKDRHRRFIRLGVYPTPTPTVAATPPLAFTSYPSPKEVSISTPVEDIEPKATPAPTTVHPSFQKSTKSQRQKTDKKTKKPSTKSVEVTPSGPVFVEFKEKKSFDLIKVLVGESFQLEITSDFFTESPSSLEILTLDGTRLAPSSWIKLAMPSAGMPYVYGIPLMNHEGLQEYILQAKSRLNSVVQIPMKFEVARMEQPIMYETNVILSRLNYDIFSQDVDLRLDFTKRIASAFGDLTTRDVLMTRLEPGSVEYWWTNKSLSASTSCPTEKVKKIQDRFINSTTLRVTENFLRNTRDYGLAYAEFVPTGACRLPALTARYIEGNVRVTPRIRVVVNSTTLQTVPYRYSVDSNGGGQFSSVLNVDGEGGERPAVESSTVDELLMQIVVPMLIVVALIIVAIIVACVACRRHGSKQQKAADATELVRKGAPVIFAHELDDHHPPSAPISRPLIPAGSPRPPNYHQCMMQQSGSGTGGGYGDFYPDEGLAASSRVGRGGGVRSMNVST